MSAQKFFNRGNIAGVNAVGAEPRVAIKARYSRFRASSVIVGDNYLAHELPTRHDVRDSTTDSTGSDNQGLHEISHPFRVAARLADRGPRGRGCGVIRMVDLRVV